MREERRSVRVWWMGWLEERRMRMELKVERIERSRWIGEDNFLVREKQGRWKMERAASRWPVPWAIIPSRYWMKMSRISDL